MLFILNWLLSQQLQNKVYLLSPNLHLFVRIDNAFFYQQIKVAFFSVAVCLVDGSNRLEGRVEVFFGRQWGTVCDDFFNMNAANVTCRELGFPRANSVRPRAGFGQGSGPILLDNVQCRGDESILPLCGHLKKWRS